MIRKDIFKRVLLWYNCGIFPALPSKDETTYLLALAFISQTWRPYMKRHSPGFFIGIVGSIILGFVVLVGVWLALGSNQGLGYEPPPLQATKTGPNSATLNLSTFPDSQVC